MPASARPRISVVELFASAQIKDPSSKVMTKPRYVHCKPSQQKKVIRKSLDMANLSVEVCVQLPRQRLESAAAW